MFYDILDKMSGIIYFRISSSELTYTVAIDFKLVSLFLKICHPYHFSYFLESLSFFFFNIYFFDCAGSLLWQAASLIAAYELLVSALVI